MASPLPPPANADPKRWKHRQEVEVWNRYHQEARKPVPAIIEPEPIPRNIDDFDAWLAFRICEAMLEGESSE